MKKVEKGITLIELLVVIVIVAILAAIAVPSYVQFVRKAHRGDAQQALLLWANNQEIYRANNNTYAGSGALAVPTDPDGRFTFRISNVSATSYTLEAVAQSTGGQDQDKERGTACTTMTLDQNNAKTPPDCWQE